MLFSISTISIISIIYMMTFIGLAWLAERKYISRKLTTHPVISMLSFGVCTGSWAWFGSIGLPHDPNITFLSYTIGIFILLLLILFVLKPIFAICSKWQLKSLSDLFSFRFHNPFIGALTAIIVVFAAIPLLSIQMLNIKNIIGLITIDNSSNNVARIFSTLMIVFISIFGIHRTSKHSNRGFLFAIAMQSILKFACIITISGFIVFRIFDDPINLVQWLAQNVDSLNSATSQYNNSNAWHFLIPLFFATTIAMPHVFYLLSIYSNSQYGFNKASWGIPIFFTISGATAGIVYWAAFKNNTIIVNYPEYSIVQLAAAINSPFLIILIYLATLAASAGVFSLVSISISSMLVNHIVLPLFKTPKQVNLYNWLYWVKKMIIPTVVLLAFLTYKLLPEKTNISNIALLSFAVMMQMLPGLFAVSYFKKANSKGFIFGILVGLSILFLNTVIPSVRFSGYDLEYWLTVSSYPTLWHWITFSSLIANCFTFYIISLFTNTSKEEIGRAQLCSYDNYDLNHVLESKSTLPELEKRLGQIIGAKAAHHEVNKVLYALNFNYDEKRTFAIEQFRNQLEANLCGLLGPSMTQNIMLTCFPHDTNGIEKDFHYLESKIGTYHNKLTGLAAELDKVRRFHRNTLQSLPIAVTILNKHNEVLLWNRAMEKITKIKAQKCIGENIDLLSEPWGKFILDFQFINKQQQVKKRLVLNNKIRWFNIQKAKIFIPDSTFKAQYMERMFSSASNNSDSTIILIEDITEKRQLEEQVIHNERLASVGQMAAGVAHEIGNPVAAIDCLAQELHTITTDDDTIEICSQVLQQTQRISKILQSLVNFSHGGSGQGLYNETNKNISVWRCCEEAINLLRLQPENKEFVFNNECIKGLKIVGDEQKFIQIIVNLLTNAVDASFHNKGEKHIWLRAYEEKSRVYLKIIDHGSGIPENLLDRIFEPFVTTKEVGKGTGLGLAVVYSLVKEYGGKIKVESPINPEKQKIGQGGCCFTLIFKLYQQIK